MVKRGVDVGLIAHDGALGSGASVGQQARGGGGGGGGVEWLDLHVFLAMATVVVAGCSSREQPPGRLTIAALAPERRPLELSLLSHLPHPLQLLEPLLQKRDGGVEDGGVVGMPPHGSSLSSELRREAGV
ncbi:hypothetical protein BHM03_00017376 [Ensete ventricosum]|nr:hypothetical protein BHM03_00017376 [Ensete ventricosum]